jgi:hypothetical protein
MNTDPESSDYQSPEIGSNVGSFKVKGCGHLTHFVLADPKFPLYNVKSGHPIFSPIGQLFCPYTLHLALTPSAA